MRVARRSRHGRPCRRTYPRRCACGIDVPGPALGTPSTQTPLPSDFNLVCNAVANTQPGQASGRAIPVGGAIEAGTGCGQAILPLSVVGSGRFHASFAVAADDTRNVPATVRVEVLGRDGYSKSVRDVTVSKSDGVRPIDVDVSGAVAVGLSFLGTPKTYVFDAHLSGTAQALRPVTAAGGASANGATAISLKSATMGCNAAIPATPQRVAGVPVAATDAAVLLGCGTVTFTLPANARGTLAVRFGSADSSNLDPEPALLIMRVLDAKGHLLRKAVGSSFIGGGLRPLWADVTGGATVVLRDEGNTRNSIVVTGVGIVPGRIAPHRNPTRVVFGAGPGEVVPVPASAFVNTCNASLGTTSNTVAKAPLVAYSFVSGTACGITQLILTDAHGRFRATFGVPDSAAPGSTATVRISVLDQDSHPLTQTAATAHAGQPGVPIDLPIDHASLLSFTFTHDAAIYDLRLIGSAVLYDRIFPPSEPTVLVPGGVAIDPRSLGVACNAAIATDDVLLVHEAALEQWTLSGTDCGSATLPLGGTLPRHTFTARYGIPAAAQQDAIAHLRLSVLDASGKVLRTATYTARSGYGPQQLSISVAGGSRLQIDWLKGSLALFAMTAS